MRIHSTQPLTTSTFMEALSRFMELFAKVARRLERRYSRPLEAHEASVALQCFAAWHRDVKFRRPIGHLHFFLLRYAI